MTISDLIVSLIFQRIKQIYTHVYTTMILNYITFTSCFHVYFRFVSKDDIYLYLQIR